MATITQKTFPGVYTTIVDKSFFTPATSSFRPGLIGVTSKGPFGIPTVVRSLKDFVQQFGRPVSTTYTEDTSTGLSTPDGSGYYLADAIDAIADYTNNVTVIRVGNQYTDLTPADVYSYGSDRYTMYSPTNAGRVKSLLDTHSNVYVKVAQGGYPTTVNARVSSASSTAGTIVLDSSSVTNALALSSSGSGYTAAQLSYSLNDKAANSAEGVLYGYAYSVSGTADTVAFAASYNSGYKNQYEFYCQINANQFSAGDVIKIKETGKATTDEVRIKTVVINSATAGTIYLEKTDIPQIGYQALPLQDNYTSASLYKVLRKVEFLRLKAATEGTWANGAGSAQGLYLRVRPGSAAGSKKLEVYWDSALVETHDNITSNPSDTTNFWSYRLAAGNSAYVAIDPEDGYTLFSDNPCAANTVAPWDSRFYGSTATTGLPTPMPKGATNAGWLAVTVGNVQDTGGQFTKGYNGENPQDVDWVGDLDPTTDTMSGIRAFEDTDTVDINILAAPMDNISLTVMEQLGRTCAKINAIALTDVPAGLNARQAIDWHNGKMPDQSGNRIDNRNVACYWNWFTMTNRFSETKLVPPTIGVLRCMALTFNNDKPWYAAAGENRGYLPIAQSVQFDRVSEDTKQAMYGNGNSVNPILKIKGRHYLYGERTMQRAESKLTAVHNVVLVNWVITGMAAVARQYVFEPNDSQLLSQLKLGFKDFLERIVNERGMEQYNLVMDDRNNTAETRNNREVIVDLELIPTDVAEKIYINAIVRESGAVLNSLG